MKMESRRKTVLQRLRKIKVNIKLIRGFQGAMANRWRGLAKKKER